MILFRDRCDAGQQLAARLKFLIDQPNVIVLGIPRGGVVVAAEVARALGAPLDVFIARKLGAPTNPELAIGAITSGSEVLIDDALVRQLRISDQQIAREVKFQRDEIARRLKMYHPDGATLELKNKTIVAIDDGVATGSTVLASLRALRQQQPAQLILGIPVSPRDTAQRLERECDQLIALSTPEPFYAVGAFYAQFEQTTDEQVIELLACYPP